MPHTAPIAPTTPSLVVDRDGPVVRVWLNRPDVRNAFNGELIRGLQATFEGLQASAGQGVRCVVLGGRGKAFCAGADLAFMREMADYTWAQNQADAEVMAAMLWAVDRCPVPVVGRIHGDCYAGGVGLASVCDVRIAAEGIHFCLSEAKLGLLPATISPYVVRAMGEAQARRWFVTAERFDAARALAMGFVHEAVPAEALDACVEGVVAAIVANGPQAVRACKQLVHDVGGRELSAELRSETARRIADVRAGSEGKEGVQSFLEKRKPAWLA